MYNIRCITESDLKEAYYVVKGAGLSSAMNFDDWAKLKRWAYFNSPLYEKHLPAGHLLEVDGKSVGFIGYSYRKLKKSSSVVTAVVLNDFSVIPKERGGVGLALCRHSINTFHRSHEIVALHHSRSAARVWKAFGASDLNGSDSTYSAIVSVKNLISRRFLFLRLSLQVMNFLFPRALPMLFLHFRRESVVDQRATPRYVIDSFSIEESNKDLINDLLERYQTTYDTGIYRDYEYLNWRYAMHPNQMYHCIVSREGERLTGLSIILVGPRGHALLCECIYDNKEDCQPERIIKLAIRSAIELGASRLYSKIVCSRVEACLQELQFTSKRKPYNQFWLYPGIQEPGNILFTYGDFKDD